MITIEKRDNDTILLYGHTVPEVCAACSSIMYTTINFIDKYNKTYADFNDNVKEDIITIRILKHDNIIDMILDNMFDMFNDLYEDNNQDKIRIIKDTD